LFETQGDEGKETMRCPTSGSKTRARLWRCSRWWTSSQPTHGRERHFVRDYVRSCVRVVAKNPNRASTRRSLQYRADVRDLIQVRLGRSCRPLHGSPSHQNRRHDNESIPTAYQFQESSRCFHSGLLRPAAHIYTGLSNIGVPVLCSSVVVLGHTVLCSM